MIILCLVDSIHLTSDGLISQFLMLLILDLNAYCDILNIRTWCNAVIWVARLQDVYKCNACQDGKQTASYNPSNKTGTESICRVFLTTRACRWCLCNILIQRCFRIHW